MNAHGKSAASEAYRAKELERSELAANLIDQYRGIDLSDVKNDPAMQAMQFEYDTMVARIDSAVVLAFNAHNVVITDKAERAANQWAVATAAGDILGQSVAQTKLEDLIGASDAFAILSSIGAQL